MNRIPFLFFFLLLSVGVQAQRIRWASKLIQFSSEYVLPDKSPSLRAVQVLGKPTLGLYTDSTACAWTPRHPDSGEEFVKVGFDTLMTIRQITVVENLGAGCLAQIFAYDEKGNEKLIRSIAERLSQDGKIWNIKLEKGVRTNTLKILLNTGRRPGYSQIDAIGISADTVSYKPTVNLARSFTKKKIVLENLGSAINSRAQELNPVISADGKTLFFTRGNHPDNIGEAVQEEIGGAKMKRQDIWVSQLVNGVWQKAQNIGRPLNNEENNAICSVSANLKTALLLNEYLPNGAMNIGVSISHFGKTGWSFPRPVRINQLNPHLNENNHSQLTEYSLSQDSRVLLMSINRSGTLGDRDLFVSFLQGNGEWSTPRNLGPDVNTAEEEGSPFLAPDGKTVYFSSKGWPGYGNHDIFVTRRLDDTWQNWSEPQNLGPEINTGGWDGYFTIQASGEYAYICSDQNSIGQEDIFRIKIYDEIKPEPVVIVSGIVLNAVTKKPLEAEVVCQVLEGEKDSIQTEYNPETGEYKLILPVKKLYGLHSSKKGFISASEEVDLRHERRFREIKRNILLIPIEEGNKIVLNTVYFPQSRAELDSASLSELDRLATAMKENPGMEINLEGHTDNLGDFNANIVLSQQRVDAVKRYLAGKGIAAGRVTSKGYGSSRPIASNLTEENRKKNRRVEFTITKI
ncbi:OmpA family protein [Siphonobacter aquaeclarae]|uniref:WD40-like Beta Propeller Repeat n=1 Tax=Siphonobacter aquaeclarae TaxID=563176 RepID=A0A1G9YCG1_9BACT|nr:OmpA family protein [Siphonobacter aquaeclarae]SDN06788.1 WD40-like Beta Propeller Repeat [Siphonobacter aquaeclarae]